MSEIQQRIRERAFQLWEQAGCPHGRGEEFWFAARQEIEGDSLLQGDQPGGAIDFPPDERTTEDPPEITEQSGAPFELPTGEPRPGEAPTSEVPAAPVSDVAVPQIHPAEPAAAEATAPMRAATPAPASTARKPTKPDNEPPRRPRNGAARPTPARPGR